jgi:hypothetical protein
MAWVVELGSHAAALTEEQIEEIQGASQNSPSTPLTSTVIPTSKGFMQMQELSNGGDANLYWVEGRCVIFVGHGAVMGNVNPGPPVTAAALKIYDRTKSGTGVCG